MSNKIEGLLIYFNLLANKNAKEILFNKIWRDYYPRVWIFSSGILKQQKPLISDVVQEIMLKVFKNLEQYNPLYSFSTWIFTIARNTCLDWKKKAHSQTFTLEQYNVKNRTSGPEELLLERHIRLRIGEFINNLSEHESQIAYLRFYERIKIKEISRIMHMPQGTVKYKIHTIKQNLKNTLAEEGYVN